MAAVLWLTRLAFATFYVLLGVLLVKTNTDSCGSVFETQVGHALVDHVVSTVVVVDEFECQLKCMGNSSCKSFNVHPGADNTKRVCELNNKTRQMKPGDFQKKKGSTYYGSVKVSCVDLSHDQTEQTNGGHCHPEYEGKQCQTPDFYPKFRESGIIQTLIKLIQTQGVNPQTCYNAMAVLEAFSLREYFRRDLEIAGLSKALDNLTSHENVNVKKRALIILTRIKAQKTAEQD